MPPSPARVAAQHTAKTVGFHGWGMTPAQMRLPGPQFTDAKPIPDEDVEEAVEYLEEEHPGLLVGYSRGGAIVMLALKQVGGKKPKVIYVAPAWRRGWARMSPPSTQGEILHGDEDDEVPLQHSCDLALQTGMPLHVVPGRNHTSILKDKLNTGGGKRVPTDKIRECVQTMPDWGAGGTGSKDEVEEQVSFVEKLGSASSKPTASMWHITKDADFSVKPGHKPWIMRGVEPHRTDKPALFVTDRPVFWTAYFQKGPLYAARIDTARLKWGEDWGEFIEPNEYLIETPEKVKVTEFIRLEEAIQKYPDQFGSLADWSSVTTTDPKTDKEYAIPRRGLTRLRMDWLKEHPGWLDPQDWYAAPRSLQDQPLLDGRLRGLKLRDVKYDDEYDEVVLGEVTTLDGDHHKWDTKDEYVLLREGVVSKDLAYDILSFFKEDYGRNPLVPRRITGTSVKFSGPVPSTMGTDPNELMFTVEGPNPEFDPDKFYTIRGVKKVIGKPTKNIGYLLISPAASSYGDKHRYSVGQVFVDPAYRRQGITKNLYSMAFKWAKSKGYRLCSGWVQSPHMDRYWRDLEQRGEAEGHEDYYNVGNKGWCQKLARRIASKHVAYRFDLSRYDYADVTAQEVLDGILYRGGGYVTNEEFETTAGGHTQSFEEERPTRGSLPGSGRVCR